MIEEMPPRKISADPARGLCEVLHMMLLDDLFDHDLYLKMFARILRALGPAEWLAIPGEWKPRVTIARKFAEAARST